MSISIDLSYPFEGSWLVQNSPANGVPSHGTRLFATSCAIDFVPATEYGSTAPVTLRTLLRPEPADRFPGFGRPILAPVAGSRPRRARQRGRATALSRNVHVRAIDGPDPDLARALPISCRDALPRNGEIVRATTR